MLQTEFNDVGYLDLPTQFRDKMTSSQTSLDAGRIILFKKILEPKRLKKNYYK
jgi:hypothetical protein